MRFEDLTYTDRELEKDAIHYLEKQVYEPSYGNKVKAFIADDLDDFKRHYDDAEYVFCNIYYDEFQNGYTLDGDNVMPQLDFRALAKHFERVFARFENDDDDIEQYVLMLDAEFKKNAFCTHMEPYFLGYDGVIATTISGYSRNPLFSVYSMVREWCMALHLKKMYPQMMRKFGFRYQRLRNEYKGDERLRRLIDFRDKYKHTFQHIGVLRAIHSSVFAYAYLFLCAVRTKEVLTAEEFIMENSSSKVTLLLQGESIRNFDFPVTKYVLDAFKEGHYKEFLHENGKIRWDALYQFTLEAIRHAGLDEVHLWGFDSLEAKTMQEFWNKSADLKKMLKILRKLALEGNNPVINRLIEMCEYCLGRPDKKQKKLERFIAETRRIMAARAYELTKPRTMAQDLVAAFPSVFLVYFQWHHNFRNIYPRVPQTQINEELLQQKKMADERKKISQRENVFQIGSLAKTLKEQMQQHLVFRLDNDKRNTQAENANEVVVQDRKDKVQAILLNRKRTMAEMALARKEAVYASSLLQNKAQQNSY